MHGGGKRKISKIGMATAGSGGVRDHMSTTIMTLCSQPWSGLFLFNPLSNLDGHNRVSRLSTVSISEKGKTDLRELRQLRTKFPWMNLTELAQWKFRTDLFPSELPSGTLAVLPVVP